SLASSNPSSRGGPTPHIEARLRPRPGWSTGTTARKSASSPASRDRSVATATGLGSPPTARCATACSAATSPICAEPCEPARAMTGSPICGALRCSASCPDTPSTTRASCNRAGRCRRSAADAMPAGQMILVRYFAGARAASGCPEEKLTAITLDDLITTLAERHGERLTTVLAASSFLVDGLANHDRTAALPAGATVDVLPPFAGG